MSLYRKRVDDIFLKNSIFMVVSICVLGPTLARLVIATRGELSNWFARRTRRARPPPSIIFSFFYDVSTSPNFWKQLGSNRTERFFYYYHLWISSSKASIHYLKQSCHYQDQLSVHNASESSNFVKNLGCFQEFSIFRKTNWRFTTS